MSNLPDAETLATLVSTVTQTMCGFSFVVAPPEQRAAIQCWRAAILEVSGAQPWKVTVFSDETAGAALGAALCQCAETEMESDLIEDSLCELLNMAAGQIKALRSEDEQLGLPRIVAPAELSPGPEDGVLLRSDEAASLMMWISQEDT